MKDETKQPWHLTTEAVRAITDALRAFGYKDLTDDRVRELSDGLLDGSISYPFRAEMPERWNNYQVHCGATERCWMAARE